MQLGIISDLHANLIALEQVLAAGEAAGVERWICLGDVLGRGPFPVETLRLVQERVGFEDWLVGNHDAALGGMRLNWGDAPEAEQFVWRWQLEQLSAAYSDPQLRVFRSLFTPQTANMRLQLQTPAAQYSFAHNTVGTYEEMTGVADHYLFPWEIVQGRQQIPLLESLLDELQRERRSGRTPTWFYGHTHLACAATGSWQGQPRLLPIHYDQPLPLEGAGQDYLLINPGSVGFPRVRDEAPRVWAEFGLLDTAANTFTFKRCAYDPQPIQDMYRTLEFPAYCLQHLAPVGAAGRLKDVRIRLWDEVYTQSGEGWEPRGVTPGGLIAPKCCGGGCC